MVPSVDLKEIERKAFRSTFQDGLWDIYMGLLLLAMAMGALMSDFGVPAARLWRQVAYIGFLGLAVVILWVGKKQITVRRMGRIKFGPRRKKRLNRVRLALAASVLLGIVFFAILQGTGSHRPEWLTGPLFFPAVWAVNCIVLFSLGAYFLDFSRLYVYGVLYAIAPGLGKTLGRWAGFPLTFVAFGLPAIVILLIGAVVFVRFLRDYPIPTEEGVNVDH
jgi:MFS family permease